MHHRQTPALAARPTQQCGQTAPQAALALLLLTLPDGRSNVIIAAVNITSTSKLTVS